MFGAFSAFTGDVCLEGHILKNNFGKPKMENEKNIKGEIEKNRKISYIDKELKHSPLLTPSLTLFIACVTLLVALISSLIKLEPQILHCCLLCVFPAMIFSAFAVFISCITPNFPNYYHRLYWVIVALLCLSVLSILIIILCFINLNISFDFII